ncbi:DUF1778 domain-containing protein [Clostridium perfringens]|nr:DUF1778 domain-containing protein [Clostridium perfringens]EJT6535638.1 DUF1778 domain-containing protein [Clostridium perfringens]
MAKKKEKFEEIKIRLTLEEKQLIKNAAALKNITMTQLILDSTVPTAKRVIENITYKEITEERAITTDKKIQKLKNALKEKQLAIKKNKIFNFARKS